MRTIRPTALLTAAISFTSLALFGCAPQEREQAAGGAAPASQPPMAGGEGRDAMPGGTPPMMGGPMMGSPTAPLTPTPELDEAITTADKSGDKKQIATAYAARGTFRMNDEKAGARIKYRAALEDYRKALAADPSNKEAKDNKAMIENIYRSMGRPVPGEEGAAAK